MTKELHININSLYTRQMKRWFGRLEEKISVKIKFLLQISETDAWWKRTFT